MRKLAIIFQTIVLLLAGIQPAVAQEPPAAPPTPDFEMPYDFEPYDYESAPDVDPAESLSIGSNLTAATFINTIGKQITTIWAMIYTSSNDFAETNPLIMFAVVVSGTSMIMWIGKIVMKRQAMQDYIDWTPPQEIDETDTGLRAYEQETYGRVWHLAGQELQRRKRDDIF